MCIIQSVVQYGVFNMHILDSFMNLNNYHFDFVTADFCFAAELYKSNHPLILCTDDVGVFCTSLSAEYALASSTFGGCYVFCTYDLTIFSASF